MKKIIISILMVFSIFIIAGCNKKDNENSIYYRNDMNIISEYNDYVIALTEEFSEFNLYSMYKHLDYEKYEKIWDFNSAGFMMIEYRRITWNDNNVYLFGYGNGYAYDIDTGKEVYSIGNLIPSIDGDEGIGRFDRLFGNDGKFIYYEFSHTYGYYYAKVTMDLKSVEVISKDDIPSDLNK